jgi:cell pole-organizing protein PopZ
MDPVAPAQAQAASAQAASAQAAPAQTVDAPLELKPGWADAPDAALPSGEATVASLQALSNLSRLVAKPDTAGAQTLDGLVREMLTPLLKQWLDAHLPEIVERHVAQEVARLSRQAQG